jgi:AmmeMemoRadiSam system protein B
MMNLREPSLPAGWYPRDPHDIEAFLSPFSGEKGAANALASAAISPHAGWFYSGLSAAASVSSLSKDADTIVIIGGHLPAGVSVLLAEEDGVRTPFGAMNIDREMRDFLRSKVKTMPDTYQDNTVEVLIPMVHYFFPKAQLLWARFPADSSSFEGGKVLAEAAEALGRKLTVLGSTDLTHYGVNYGFSPMGRGKKALDWVRRVNDAAFIKAVLSGNPDEVLVRSEEDFSACSAGAVLGVMGFISRNGAKPELLDYRTSADALDGEIPDSFVGYASVTFS